MMTSRGFFPFYPEKILWIGSALLVACATIEASYLWIFQEPRQIAPPTFAERKSESTKEQKLSISFCLNDFLIKMPLPRLESEIAFSCDPPRPDDHPKNTDVFIKLKKSSQSKRISLPCRLDLCYLEGTNLGFSATRSPFWIDLSLGTQHCINVRAWIETQTQGTLEAEQFSVRIQESPIQTAKEFPEGSPFRILAEARWLGQNVFFEKFGSGIIAHRINLESPQTREILEIREGDWLVWKEERWIKGNLENQNVPVARIETVEEKSMILEGWHEGNHVRLALPLHILPPMKMRGEEVFTSIRIRSEKQISCMMEKQCLILKCGDWVLKSDNRWRILRKPEEKESYKSGKMVGELFVFEKIDIKQGQKFIHGLFFNLEKTQATLVDIAAHKHPIRKGKKRMK